MSSLLAMVNKGIRCFQVFVFRTDLNFDLKSELYQTLASYNQGTLNASLHES